jgi:glycosyltransferase involved in cell wall biosynthesis
MKNKKLLFLSNHAAFFVSHRINIFYESLKKKYHFYLIFGKPASEKMEKSAIKKLKKENVKFLNFNYSNNSISLLNDFSSMISMIRFIRKYNPKIIHSASPKANIYAGILAKLFSKVCLVMSFSGMGYLYTEKKLNFFLNIKKIIFDVLISFIFSKHNKRVIVQNNHDYFLLKKKFNINTKHLIKIKGGSGVDIKKFSKIKKKTKNVVMISRVLKNKGVLEFFKAAKLLKLKYPEWKFIIVGSLDYNSPDKIDLDIINYYKKKKLVSFLGYKENISNILANTEIFCLPSHREGMPKATLEALAAGVPVVTSNAIGCIESILPNKNGLICKQKNYKSLAFEVEKLIINPKLRKKFSINARKYAKSNLSINNVSKKIFEVYEDLLNE